MQQCGMKRVETHVIKKRKRFTMKQWLWCAYILSNVLKMQLITVERWRFDPMHLDNIYLCKSHKILFVLIKMRLQLS